MPSPCAGAAVESGPTGVSRAVVATQNALFGLTGRDFRTFAHDPRDMLEVLAGRGLHLSGTHRGRVWHAEAVTR